ncbi:MAG: flagellar filament capping protein FliD [Gemmatimonadaceae bacterium]|nr:flagellar filament capping protein FliD [Gemmatimonadaceae bacterium]
MGTSIGFGGLASGVQWRDLVDQLIAAERARNIGRFETQIDQGSKQQVAWRELTGLVQKLEDAAGALKLGTGFRSFATSISPTPSGRALFSASASSTATPGAYRVEVLDLARAGKVSGGIVADPAAALGRSGAFQVAGQTVSVAATDSLNDVRDRINALNTGANATRVSASILTSSAGASRLILSAEQAGSTGVALTDGPEGTLRDLGFLDSQSRTVSSATTAIAAALGVTMPPPATIRVGDQTITVDLTTDSLSSIAARIRAAGVQAEVNRETVGAGTQFRLSIGANVQASDDPGSEDVLTALGITEGGRGTVKQVLASADAFTRANGTPAIGSTRLVDLFRDGANAGVTAGSALTFTGTRGDGTTVSVGITVTATTTVNNVLARLNDATTGFGAGTRPATASLGPDGRIRLEDGTGGDSRLSLTASLSPAGGGPAQPLGAIRTETVGRSRELVRGSDAQLRVDGVLVTRNSNTIGDALAGVTFTLQQAEPGTVVDFTVSRNEEAGVKAVEDFASAYNDIVSFFNGQQLDGQPLANEPTLRRVLASFTQALRTQVPAAGDFNRAPLAGITLSRTGRLDVDTAKLRTAMATNLPAIQSLLGEQGIGNAMVEAARSATRVGNGTISSQLSSIDNSASRLRERIGTLQQRLDERRERLIAQFTAMESSLARLQAQGSSLTAAVSGLRGSNRN